jgi:hypothetical protein
MKPRGLRWCGKTGRELEAHRASGQHLLPRLGRQWFEPSVDHLGRPGEEAVGVRIIGRPHYLVRSDVVGRDGEPPSTGSNEIQQVRWNNWLGRVFRPESLRPWNDPAGKALLRQRDGGRTSEVQVPAFEVTQ